MATATSSRAETEAGPSAFLVHLDVFSGPFDLLLSLISKHELDVTLVALAQVTDEFIARSRAAGVLDLGETTEFLVVAATLLDLKASRLLPVSGEDDEEDLALLEARDVLFARLLQYRAYKQAARLMERLIAAAARWTPRQAGLPPELAAVLPDVVLGVGVERLAALAAAALTPKPAHPIEIDYIHAPRVSVREHAALVLERLQEIGSATFRALCAECSETIEVVARFLAILELYREGLVGFEQLEPLGELLVRWSSPPPMAIGPGRDVAARAGAVPG